MHEGNETWEEHLAIVLRVEICGLLRTQSQPPFLRQTEQLFISNTNLMSRHGISVSNMMVHVIKCVNNA